MGDREKTPVSELAEGSSAESAELKAGTVISQRYRIISAIGKGGMGVVYRVEQTLLQKELALKTIDRNRISDIALRRFQKEARAAFAVDHPNIIAVHDFGLLDDQTPFMVMDLIKGETLAQRIAAQGFLKIDEAIPIFVQVCFGLLAAHNQGVVHRDIKPSNIMLVEGANVGSEGSVKIVDFGIAKFTQSEGGEIQSLTQTGEIFGSPLYMSPEQCRGGKVDHHADIYSLGCVLFEALTGTTPFVAENSLATMIQHQSDTAPSLREATLGKEFPAALEAIVAKMLDKDPAQRYHSLGVVAHQLSDVSNDAKSGTTSSPNSYASSLTTAAKGKTMVSLTVPQLVALLICTGLAFAAGGIFLHLALKKEPHSPTERPISTGLDKSRQGSSPVSDLSNALLNAENDNLNDILMKPLQHGRLTLKGIVPLPKEQLTMLAKRPGLKVFELDFCEFDNRDLVVLQQAPQLEAFLAIRCNLNDEGAEILSRCKKLNYVEANKTQITDRAIASFLRLTNLKKLEFADTKVTGKALTYLPQLKKLRYLRVNSIKALKDSDLAPLAGMRLATFYAADTSIGDGAMDYLAKVKGLGEVGLDGTKVSLKGVLKLLENRTVYKVCLADCPNISENDLSYLRAHHPELTIHQARRDAEEI